MKVYLKILKFYQSSKPVKSSGSSHACLTMRYVNWREGMYRIMGITPKIFILSSSVAEKYA